MGYGNYIDPFVGRRPDYTVGAGEKLELTFVVLPGESRDIDVAIDLVGEGAEVSLKGLYLCGGEERVNFHILMHHRAGGCVSHQLFNGVETTPQLEIYADDVKCSHGATTGRLDEDALFYMRTRGVPESEAKVLQMISFLAAVTPEDRKEDIENAVNQIV